MIAAIESSFPTLAEARSLTDRFHAMIRQKGADLDCCISDAAPSLVAPSPAASAETGGPSLLPSRCPGQTARPRAKVTRLKLVKRQMYGRAKIDLLEARLIGAA